MLSWPDFRFPAINLWILPLWREKNMNYSELSEDSFELLKQIQTETVKWTYQNQQLAGILAEGGYIVFPDPSDFSAVPFLSQKGRKVVGM